MVPSNQELANQDGSVIFLPIFEKVEKQDMSLPKARPSHLEIGQHYISIGPEQGLMPVWKYFCHSESGHTLWLTLNLVNNGCKLGNFFLPKKTLSKKIVNF